MRFLELGVVQCAGTSDQAVVIEERPGLRAFRYLNASNYEQVCDELADEFPAADSDWS